MAPQHILDAHIHLWPSTATSSSNHSWMTRGNFLAKRHGISDYLAITSPPPQGFIYVETDRRLPSPEPSISDSTGDTEIRTELESWAKEPLDELRFLRRIAQGTPEDGDGFTEQEDADRMFGCVIYAPFHLAPRVFNIYMTIAKEIAGERLWSKVVGFRYLLQGKGEGAVSKMLTERGEWWDSNLCALKELEGTSDAWCFDVGVDTHRDGMEPTEAVASLIKRVRAHEDREGASGKRVKFVLNHLAKPPLSTSNHQPNPRWLAALSTLSADQDVYMKLSGALNEFDNQPTPADIPTLLTALTPYLEHAFHCFPHRVMFGSDWPVCNVGGPAGEEGNWRLWRDVVEAWMERQGLGEKEREEVWHKAGAKAYGLKDLKGLM